MKPTLFKKESDLIAFIDRLPVGDQKVKVQGMFDGNSVECAEIVAQMKSLVPRIFELRRLIAKGIGGLGNYRSLDRFSEAAADNISMEYMGAYLTELEKIQIESEVLVEGGLSEEIAKQLATAKSKVAAHNLMNNVIMNFDVKIQTLVSRLSEKYESLSSSLEKTKVKTDNEAKSAILIAIGEFRSVQESVISLGEDLHKYCLLQVAYNSTLMK